MSHAVDAVDGQTPHHRPPHHDGAGAERQGLDDVGTPSHATVDVDLAAARDGVDHSRQGVGRRHRSVQLAATVVRDGDGRGARVEACPGVVGAQDPLDDDREPG